MFFGVKNKGKRHQKRILPFYDVDTADVILKSFIYD
jgi:hypothetical protein